MKKLLVLFTAVVLVLGMSGLANAYAPVLTFEDLYPGYEGLGKIPSNYKGFTWGSNSYWITDKYHPGSGYDYGTTGKVSLFTGWEADIYFGGSLFDFNGATIAAAWNSGQDVTVEGWNSGSLVYSSTIMTSYDQPYWFNFNFTNVDQVWFKPGNLGTNQGFGGSGHHIVIDNVNVPEPATLVLLGAGLLGLGVVGRIRRKRK